ncbi:RecBCD enzyme subunit RecC [Serratia plymuthica]|nr:RecBCD enzyme subunit RecC [Serratia plymuthica]
MFRVYHSNQLDLLKTLTSTLIAREPLADPFQQEVVLVQSPGMAQWLQMQLAEQFGIAANIVFPLPATFIWDMFTRVLPGIPKESAFSKDAMTWKLMWLLPDLLTRPEFAPLQHYLTDDGDKRKIHQLAGRVADLFDQYLVYRPQWLESWQKGESIDGLAEAQQWQAPLWVRLVEYTHELGQPEWHRANLYRRFISVLEKAERCPEGLPPRVFICGISALPPVYLEALQALGRHIDIHLMFTNPCRYYWGIFRASHSWPNCRAASGAIIRIKRNMPYSEIPITPPRCLMLKANKICPTRYWLHGASWGVTTTFYSRR